MATLKICVQKQKKDGAWPVYIRVTHGACDVSCGDKHSQPV